MKALRVILLFLAATGLIAVVVFTIRGVSNRTRQPEETVRPHTAPDNVQRSTPADRRIQAGQGKIQLAPTEPDGYNLLSAAYMQKARETGDFSFNARAETALNKSFEVAPDNYDALKLRAKLLLIFHRFGEALEAARRAQTLSQDDHDVYGALTDSLVELGRYEEAIEAAQKMVDLRPDTAAYARVSYLRALHGDRKGAIEAMIVAAKAADPRDPESVAWCRVHLGDELMNAGELKLAEREFDNALYAFPDYPVALAAKARARVASGDTTGAIDFYKRAQDRVPSPETAIALGNLYAKLGRAEEAKQQYDLVEFIERAGANSGTYSRLLALFWADHDTRLDDALTIARRERLSRADIYTCDTLAWCLFKKGQFAEAKSSIDEALRLGTEDARIYYHAGMIYHALGDRRNAAKYLKLALKIDSSFDIRQADLARRALDTLNA